MQFHAQALLLLLFTLSNGCHSTRPIAVSQSREDVELDVRFIIHGKPDGYPAKVTSAGAEHEIALGLYAPELLGALTAIPPQKVKVADPNNASNVAKDIQKAILDPLNTTHSTKFSLGAGKTGHVWHDSGWRPIQAGQHALIFPLLYDGQPITPESAKIVDHDDPNKKFIRTIVFSYALVAQKL